MKNSVFIPVCILLFAGYLQAFSFFKLKFSGADQLRMKNAQLEKTTRQANLRTELARFQLADYQQHVATLIPESLRPEDKSRESKALRGIASIASGGLGRSLDIEGSSSMFERARNEFAHKDFAASKETLDALLRTFPNSGYVPEAYFLLIESKFQTKDYEGAVSGVDTMVSLFPENDLTGYALIRLGKIYEMQERSDDAVDIYKTIAKFYNDKKLQEQAGSLLKAAKL